MYKLVVEIRKEGADNSRRGSNDQVTEKDEHWFLIEVDLHWLHGRFKLNDRRNKIDSWSNGK